MVDWVWFGLWLGLVIFVSYTGCVNHIIETGGTLPSSAQLRSKPDVPRITEVLRSPCLPRRRLTARELRSASCASDNIVRKHF